jgi:hypothetical protein
MEGLNILVYRHKSKFSSSHNMTDLTNIVNNPNEECVNLAEHSRTEMSIESKIIRHPNPENASELRKKRRKLEGKIINMYYGRKDYDRLYTEEEIIGQLRAEGEEIGLRDISTVVRKKAARLNRNKGEVQDYVNKNAKDILAIYDEVYSRKGNKEKAIHRVVQKLRVETQYSLTLKQVRELIKNRQEVENCEVVIPKVIVDNTSRESRTKQISERYNQIQQERLVKEGVIESVQRTSVEHKEDMRGRFSSDIEELYRTNVHSLGVGHFEEVLAKTRVQFKESTAQDLSEEELVDIVYDQYRGKLTKEQDRRLWNMYNVLGKEGVAKFKAEMIAKRLDPANPIDPFYIKLAFAHFECFPDYKPEPKPSAQESSDNFQFNKREITPRVIKVSKGYSVLPKEQREAKIEDRYSTKPRINLNAPRKEMKFEERDSGVIEKMSDYAATTIGSAARLLISPILGLLSYFTR